MLALLIHLLIALVILGLIWWAGQKKANGRYELRIVDCS